MFAPRLTPSRFGRVDLFTSIDRVTTLKETLTIAYDWLPLLNADQKILYINALYGERELHRAIAKQFARKPAGELRRLLTQYLRPDQLNGHLEFFEAVVRDENVKVVILDCFDFAALTPNRQSKLAGFFKVLKDIYDVHVVVSVIGMPSHSTGSGKSLLGFIADSQSESGSYLMAKSGGSSLPFGPAREPAEEEEEVAQLVELPISPLDYRKNIPNYDLPSFMKNQEGSLTNKELEAAKRDSHEAIHTKSLAEQHA